jgi:hypothetical protein
MRVTDLDDIVSARFLALAGDLRYSEVTTVEERPDTARRTDLTDALRVARAALADAVESEDEAGEAAARAQVRTLRAELDDLPADVTTRRERVWSSETYGETFARLDTAGRRELLAALVTVTVGPAVERTATGQYDNTRPRWAAACRPAGPTGSPMPLWTRSTPARQSCCTPPDRPRQQRARYVPRSGSFGVRPLRSHV